MQIFDLKTFSVTTYSPFPAGFNKTRAMESAGLMLPVNQDREVCAGEPRVPHSPESDKREVPGGLPRGLLLPGPA